MAQQGGEELANREAAPAPSEAGTIAAAGEKSVYDAPAALKDKDTNVDPDSVKAPGLMDRAKEEVEAMAETLQDKLDINKSSDEPASATPAAAEQTDKAAAAKEPKDEQTGLFKRWLKKLGFAKN